MRFVAVVREVSADFIVDCFRRYFVQFRHAAVGVAACFPVSVQLIYKLSLVYYLSCFFRLSVPPFDYGLRMGFALAM